MTYPTKLHDRLPEPEPIYTVERQTTLPQHVREGDVIVLSDSNEVVRAVKVTPRRVQIFLTNGTSKFFSPGDRVQVDRRTIVPASAKEIADVQKENRVLDRIEGSLWQRDTAREKFAATLTQEGRVYARSYEDLMESDADWYWWSAVDEVYALGEKTPRQAYTEVAEQAKHHVFQTRSLRVLNASTSVLTNLVENLITEKAIEFVGISKYWY